MNISTENPVIQFVFNWMQHYNHNRYWNMRKEVTNPLSKTPLFIRFFYFFRIKRMDLKNKSTMGTNIGSGAYFETPPELPHGLNGILISYYAKIGKQCIIYQQVTIAEGEDKQSAIIGDFCEIGAGAKIIGKVSIGNNVKIGANAVVVKDVPDNCTVVGVPAQVVKMNPVYKVS